MRERACLVERSQRKRGVTWRTVSRWRWRGRSHVRSTRRRRFAGCVQIRAQERVNDRLERIQLRRPRTFTDPRLCAAIVDRLTFGGTIIETGTDSYRLAQTRNRAEQRAT
jgi:hypothetical protein